MLTEEVKWGMFLAMMFFGLSSLAAFIAAQVYVKSKTPGLWQQFFPGRSIGFAHDLKFHRFTDWFFSARGIDVRAQLALFPLLWRYHSVVSKLGLILSGLFVLDVFVVMYQSGMIGGWRFR